MYKKIISSILVASLLNLFGCYSYSALSEEEMESGLSFPDEAYRFVLNDGSEIIYQPNEKVSIEKWESVNKTILISVDEPSNLIAGAGYLYDNKSKEQTIYWGVINGELIDSTKSAVTNGVTYVLFWLKDSTRVTFKPFDYFRITPEDGTGYWVKGEKNYKAFWGKIEISEVKDIQEESPLISSTAGYVIGAILAMGFFVLVGVAASGNWGGSSGW